MVEVDEKMNK